MTNYILREESGAETTIEAEDFTGARKQARAWVSGGCYDNITSTVWIECRITDVDADDADIITVAIDPEEPRCSSDGGHAWGSPDIAGHGAGLTTTETCSHCGCRKTSDTWATNLKTGKQGVCSIAYDFAEA